MNPRQQYLKQYQTGQTALTGNSPTPASNTSATGTVGTQITPSTTSTSLQNPAAQTYIQNQQQSTPTPTPTQASQANVYGSTITDTSGNPGVAQFNSMTGQPLSPTQNSGSSGTSSSLESNPYQDYVNSLTQARNSVAQYATPTPDELSAATNLATAKSNYTTANTQANQQNENILNASGGTLAGAQEAAQIEGRHNNANLANLADVQNADANTLSALTTNQQANLAGAQAGLATKAPLQIGDTYIDPQTGKILSNTPTQVAPGTGLFNTATGQFTPGSGAAPAQIASTAQQLEQSAIQQGNVVTNSDGSINHDYYTQQAQNYYQTGSYGNGGSSSSSTNGSNTSASTSSIAPQYQSYVGQTASGATYVSQDKLANLTPTQLTQATEQYAAAGIPVLTSDQTNKIQSIDVTQQNLNGLESLTTGIDPTTGQQVGTPLLGSGPVGRVGSAIGNTVAGITQSNPNVAAFNNYRLTAINTLQSLGAGSGGSRITAAEIATAVDNLPNLTDSVQTAKAKLAIVNGYLSKWQDELIPKTTPSSSSSQNSSSGNGNSSATSTSGFGWNG